MKRVAAFTTASGAFLRSLVSRRSKVVGHSQNGHPLFEGWSRCPEEGMLELLEGQKAMGKRAARVTLLCLEGPHSGEYFSLSNSVEILGRDAQCSLVLTPNEATRTDRCRIFINGTIRMLAETGSHFKVNGHDTEASELFDYDEIDVLGNRFLVLVRGIA